MDCNDCKENLGSFLDNELDAGQAELVREHLALCGECAAVCEDLSSILFTCASEAGTELVPPNSQALWCRISNTIESEIKPEPLMQLDEPKRRSWRLSLPQLAVAVFTIAIISSALTLAGIRAIRPAQDAAGVNSGESRSTFARLLAKVGLVETAQQARDRRVREQQAAIAYWDNRVQTRRVQWDARTREAFDRNLKVINESIDQYSVILQEDPEDDLSAEMFDSVLNDKMSLLRDFSDL